MAFALCLHAMACSSNACRLRVAIVSNVLMYTQASTPVGQPTTKKAKLNDNTAARRTESAVKVPVKQPQKQKPKKQRPMTPELQLTLAVQNAAKSKHAALGVAAYNKAIAEGTHINPDLYSNLLYLCAGCDDWELPLRHQLIETSPLVEEVMQMAAASSTSDAAESPDGAYAEADAVALHATPNGNVSCNGTDNQGATHNAASLPTAVAIPVLTASTAAANDATASESAPQPERESIADGTDEVAVATTSGRQAPDMSAAELHAAGRTIFAHMQV